MSILDASSVTPLLEHSSNTASVERFELCVDDVFKIDVTKAERLPCVWLDSSEYFFCCSVVFGHDASGQLGGIRTHNRVPDLLGNALP